MDRIRKELKRLDKQERLIVEHLLIKLYAGEIINLDIKKLRGYDDIYRLKKNRLRIIYRTDEKGKIFLLHIGRRSDNTYKFL